MERFNALSEEKEHLSRELADACRDYIDLKCRHNEILLRYHVIKKALADRMIKFNETTTSQEAAQKISEIMESEMAKNAQLDLPLTQTQEIESDG